MSRRDTIIIAVLLNAGLLIFLFATSLKSDKVENEPSAITVLASNPPPSKAPPSKEGLARPHPLPMAASVASDQVDKVIEQYVTPQIAQDIPQNPNFLADLQAIGSAPTGTESLPVAPTPEPLAESTAHFKEVVVKKGDVLERIARQNHVSVSDLMKVNKLNSSRLKIGQVLKIPATSSATPSSSVAHSINGAQYYTVKAGDNPWTIAVKHHMKVEELLKLNNMDEQKARRLKAGDKIRVK